jgi:hypothetical protein
VIKGHKARYECKKVEEKDVEMSEEAFQPNNMGGGGFLVRSLYIFERDSKFIYEFEIQS